jgi:septal ring factor EnvC (AmiA/AmiB activator)
VEQRYAKLEAEQRELTTEFDIIQDEMADAVKRLTRLDNEYIKSEIHMKEQRLHFERL